MFKNADGGSKKIIIFIPENVLRWSFFEKANNWLSMRQNSYGGPNFLSQYNPLQLLSYHLRLLNIPNPIWIWIPIRHRQVADRSQIFMIYYTKFQKCNILEETIDANDKSFANLYYLDINLGTLFLRSLKKESSIGGFKAEILRFE